MIYRICYEGLTVQTLQSSGNEVLRTDEKINWYQSDGMSGFRLKENVQEPSSHPSSEEQGGHCDLCSLMT